MFCVMTLRQFSRVELPERPVFWHLVCSCAFCPIITATEATLSYYFIFLYRIVVLFYFLFLESFLEKTNELVSK